MEDTDELQLTKITQFYKHVEGMDKIGVVLGEEDGGKVRNIEKWPLIQAYGLEELGKAFFSMTHTPVNVKRSLYNIYQHHDSYSLKYNIDVV